MSAMTVKVVIALNFSAERWLVNIKKRKRDTYATSREKILVIIRITLFLKKVNLLILRKINHFVNAIDNHSQVKSRSI